MQDSEIEQSKFELLHHSRCYANVSFNLLLPATYNIKYTSSYTLCGKQFKNNY